MTYWCRTAVLADGAHDGVRISHAGGRITAIESAVAARAGDIQLDTVFAGFGNAHSHAFHRVLRGRTHDDGGDFWQWRDSMYKAAAHLTPDSYRELATAVFAEMLADGYTAVGEFHYVHHQPDGTPYADHAMERALAAASTDVGIRLTLIDTCYLAGGIDAPLSRAQARFSDKTADGWLARWYSLRDALADYPLVTLGAAIHSVRAVPRSELAVIAAGLPADVPLHAHLSEQPQENADSLAAYGLTPTQVLASAGLLTNRLTVVHATHLTDGDIALLGGAGVSVVMCPTTEADLGDGIGPARKLADAGAHITLGSDQNAVIDPFLEARGLEAGERLASGQRARFSPAALNRALTSDGYSALGLDGGLKIGALCDLVELTSTSVRTIGARAAQLPLVATASDVRRVIVGGVVVASSGLLANGRDPADRLASSLDGPQ